MNAITMIVMMIIGFIIIGTGIFLVITRSGKNLVTSIIKNKKYVICHLKNENTEFEEVWKVVPATDFITLVGKHNYNLNPRYALMKWKGRLHFTLSEADVIPKYLDRTNSTEEILIQVGETDTAINTRAYKIIYGKQLDIALIVCAIAFIIAVLTAMYAIYEIDRMTNTIQIIYSNSSTIIRTGN